MNNTSLIASTDNTINNNPPTSTSTQTNDTSNSKKSSEKSIIVSQPKSKDQLAPTALTEDNTTHEKASSVTQDKNIIDTKQHETSQNKLTNLRSENNSNTLVEKVQNKDTSSKNSENQPSSVSAPEKPSSVTEDKTITKVKSPKSDNQPEKQSLSSDSIKRDRALFFKYLNSNSDNVKSDHNDKTLSSRYCRSKQSTCCYQ